MFRVKLENTCSIWHGLKSPPPTNLHSCLAFPKPWNFPIVFRIRKDTSFSLLPAWPSHADKIFGVCPWFFPSQTYQDLNKILWGTHLAKRKWGHPEYWQQAGKLLSSALHEPHKKEAKTTRILWSILLSGLGEVEKKCSSNYKKERICQTSRSIPI